MLRSLVLAEVVVSMFMSPSSLMVSSVIIGVAMVVDRILDPADDVASLINRASSSGLNGDTLELIDIGLLFSRASCR